MTSNSTAYEALFHERYHGSSNVCGIQFQQLYFASRCFDLYADEPPEYLLGEGLEDVDRATVQGSREYTQVKYRSHTIDWSQLRRVLLSFQAVWAVDSSARFRLVTNAGFSGEADQLRSYLARHGNRKSLPNALLRKVEAIFGNDSVMFLERMTIEQVSLTQLEKRTEAAVIRHFDVTTGNEALYVRSLLADLLNRMVSRVEVRRTDIERIRLGVEDAIAVGRVNPAVQNGFVHFLNYDQATNSEDFYEGVAARPEHIAGLFDVPRPLTLHKIDETLAAKQVCVVLASSGQGKSTIAYRWAFDHAPSEARFRVTTCRSEDEAGQIALFLEGRLRLGLPLIVLIDNLGHATRLWHHLVERFAGQRVSFIVTSREEDWFRYGGRTIGFTWDIVRPELDRTEALQIYSELQQRGRIHPDVPSGEWAYEHVQEQKLLIEYVYLLTHGRMLSERLREQVVVLSREDPSKLEALRLVSVAHIYGVQVPMRPLVQQVGFRSDPQQSLLALNGEYLLCHQDGFCEGLHPVRSRHLVEMLHFPLPVEDTIATLITFLHEEALVAFVRSALSDSDIKVDVPLAALVDRCTKSEPGLTSSIAGACFDAEEQRHFLRHRRLFDEAFRLGGEGRVLLLAMCDSPRGKVDVLQMLRDMEAPDSETSIDQLQVLVDQITPRVLSHRIDHRFLTEVLPRIDLNQLVQDLGALSSILDWCFGADVTLPHLTKATNISDWEERLFDLPITEASYLSFTLSRFVPDDHRAWVRMNRKRLISFFKYHTCSITATEEDREAGLTIRITFPVDWASPNERPHEQATSRLMMLHRLNPYYDVYESQGIHLLNENQIVPYDDTFKQWDRVSIWQELDTEKNREWTHRCEDWYAADSLTTWLSRWNMARQLANTAVKDICRFHLGTSDQTGHFEALAATINELQDALEHLPSLPASMPKEFRSRIKGQGRNWVNALLNFIRQWRSQDRNDSSNRNNFLMRHNLKDARKALPELHNALKEVLSVAGEVGKTPAYGRAAEDTARYQELTDTLDFIYDRDETLPHPPNQAGGVLGMVTAWARAREQRIVTTVIAALRELENDGYTFVYPTQLVEEYPLHSLCIGVVVHDFNWFLNDIAIVLENLGKSQLESENLTVTYIQVLPLLPDKRSYDCHIRRVAVETLHQMINGQVPEGMWLLPMDVTPDVKSVLPSIVYTPLSELTLITTFSDAITTYLRQRRLIEMIDMNIDPADASDTYWIAKIQEQYPLDRAIASMYGSVTALRTFMPSAIAVEESWQRIIAHCDALIERCLERGDSEDAYTLFGSGSEFDRLLNNHLNAYL